MKDVYHFEQECMQTLATQTGMILDVGGGSRFMKRMAQHEELFSHTDYKTLDVSPDYRPDIVGDIHNIPLADGDVDGIICRSVLEHVADPRKAVQEMLRILKPGGYIFLEVPSIYPYHARVGKGGYPDHWRFFESGIRLLLQDCSEIHVMKHGGWFRAMSFFFPTQARLRFILNPLSAFLDKLFHTEERTNTSFYSVFARK